LQSSKLGENDSVEKSPPNHPFSASPLQNGTDEPNKYIASEKMPGTVMPRLVSIFVAHKTEYLTENFLVSILIVNY
jgi:hypothetical protein